jgi:hypothetical protein
VSIAGLQPGAEMSEAAALASHRRRHMPADLRRVFQDGCAWAAMMGFGEHLFQAMMVALALGESAAAFAVVSPALLGATLQLCAPWLVHRLRSHKRVVLLGSMLQVVCFVPLAAVCVLRATSVLGPGQVPKWAIYAVLSVYYFGGITAGTAWSSWVSTIVPKAVRGGYFSVRTRWISIVHLSAQVCTVGVLWWSDALRGPGALWGFAFCMLMAAGFRSLSTALENRTTEPVPVPRGHRWVGLHEALWKMLHGPSAGLVGCYVLMAVAQAVALPFLVPMVLGPLKEKEAVVPIVLGASMVGRIGGYFVLPKLLKRWKGPRTLCAAGVALVPLYLIPAVSPSLATVLVMQVAAGVVYACWEVTAWLMILEHTPSGERTSYLSLHYFGNYVAMLAGASFARVVLGHYTVVQSAADAAPSAFELDGYRTVFVLSCVARLMMVVPLILWVRRATRARAGHH